MVRAEMAQWGSPQLMAGHCVPPRPGYEPLAPLPPAASAVPVWQDRTIASAKLRLLEYSAFMEVPRDAETVMVPWSPACPPDPARIVPIPVLGDILLSSDLLFFPPPTAILTVQQTPLCAHWSDEPLVQ